MPVPTLITDLSATIGSNSPAGSESASGTIDDYLRAHAGFIAQTRAGTSATTYTFSATGARIQGDFSNATVANRPLFQTSTTNGSSSVGVITNGTATNSNFVAWNNSTGTAASYISIQAESTRVSLDSGVSAGGTNLPLGFVVAGAEAARFTTAGQFLVGTTNATIAGNGSLVGLDNPTVGRFALNINTVNQGGTYFLVNFGAAGTQTGQITSDGTTTSYTTTSDYRLKENVQPMTGALAKVLALKPVTYTWKRTGTSGQGFIAHELHAVIPDAVTGAKDDVDSQGVPRYQGMDTSHIVATLVAAVKELTARVAVLEAA